MFLYAINRTNPNNPNYRIILDDTIVDFNEATDLVETFDTVYGDYPPNPELSICADDFDVYLRTDDGKVYQCEFNWQWHPVR